MSTPPRRSSLSRRLMFYALLGILAMAAGMVSLATLLVIDVGRQVVARSGGQLSAAEYEALVIERAFSLAPWAAALVVLLLLGARVASRAMLRPLNRLTLVTDALRRGEFGTEVAVGVGGEVGQLAESLNATSRALLSSSRALEEQNRALALVVRRLEGTLQVGQVLASTLDGEQLIRRVAAMLRTAFGYERVGVAILERDSLIYHYSSQAESGLSTRLRVPVSDRLVAGRAVLTAQPLLVPDLRADPRLVAPDGLPACRSELAVPVMHNSAVQAVLDLQSSQPQAFSDEDQQLVLSLVSPLALALVNTGLFQAERLRRQLAEAIYRISQQVSNALAPSTVADLVLDQVARLFPFDRAALVVLRDGSEEQVLLHGAPGGELITAEGRMLLDQAHVARARSDRRARIIAGAATSGLIAPLASHGRLVGLLLVERDLPDAYDDEELNALCALAAQAAVVIENTRLSAETQDLQGRLKVVSELTAAVTSSYDLPSMLRTIIQQIRKVVPCDHASIALYEPEDDSFTLELFYDALLPELPPRARLPAEGTPWKSAYNAMQPIYQRDLEKSAFSLDQELAARGLRSSVVVPIVTDTHRVGTLNLASREPTAFSLAQVQTLLELSRYFATALRNARLAQEREDASARLARTEQYLTLVEKLRAIGQLASGVAHDFNNLLAGVLGNAQLLLLEITDNEQRKLLKIIEQAARDGAETVRRLQGFARADQSGAMIPVRLDLLAKDAIDLTRPRWRDIAQSRGVRIELRSELLPTPAIAGRPSELREVLTNLIINAVDAMPEGGILTVRSFSEGDPPEIVGLEVSDTGVGMPPEIQERIFEAFFTTKGREGTGLGLAVSSGIARAHGGELTVESEVGKGSRFIMRLPVRAPEQAMERQEAPLVPARPGRVLVIEDEPMVRGALVGFLAHWGHAVIDVADGAAALAQFGPGRYDLVICDLGMPDISGVELLGQLKQRDPRIATVLITGWGTQVDDNGHETPPADYVLAKPFEQADLSRVLARILR